MLALMLFAACALVCNGWWQKRTPLEAQKSQDEAQKKMLPHGWAVHLNDEGNIYYVHQASGRSTWEFPVAETPDQIPADPVKPAQKHEIMT